MENDLMDQAKICRPEITLNLAKMLEKHIDPHNDPRVYWAKEVTFDYATGERCV